MNYLDDFICCYSPEEHEDYYEDQMWYETVAHFCEEMGINPEIYED